MKSLKSFIFIILFFQLFPVSALDLVNIWRHSEIAGKNSVFCDIAISPVNFEDLEVNLLPVDIRFEYFPPFPLPFSVGLFFITPYPNLKHFGARFAYHFDLFDPVTDFYFVYSYNFGYILNDVLVEYNDTPVELLMYDFRIGVRRFFNNYLGLAVESGYHFESIIIMLSIKIN